MIISDLNAPFDDHSQINSESTHCWHSDRSNYSEQQIGEMPTWIKNMKESIYQALPENYQNVNLATLSEMQALVYNIVQSHYNDLSPNKEKRRRNWKELSYKCYPYTPTCQMCSHCNNWQSCF